MCPECGGELIYIPEFNERVCDNCEYREKEIKEVIDSYEGIIPEPFYSRLKTAMYNYEVEITD